MGILITDIQGRQFVADEITISGGSITVSATDLDIRNLTFANDAIDVTGSAVRLIDSTDTSFGVKQTGNAIHTIIDDGGGSVTVDGSVTVSATNLDIRDLTSVSDSVKIGDADGHYANVETRVQTPTGMALNVQIGPGDVISNIPVVMDFGQHQVHEGESFFAQYVDTGLDTATIKFVLTVGAYANPIQAPHLKIGVDIYNGSARLDLYEGIETETLSTALTVYNRHRNITVPASAMDINLATAVTGTTLLESSFVGAGMKGSTSGESRDEWILKPSTNYAVYLTGLVAGTDAIIHFEWDEDLGV